MRTRYEQMTAGGLDGYDNFAGDDSDYRDWYGVAGRSRDSDCLEESNFDAATKEFERIDPEANDWMSNSYGHWAVGWVEQIYVRPKSKCYDVAVELREALENYPVLDDEDFSRREQEAAGEVWANFFVNDRIEYIRKNRDQFEFHDFASLLSCVRGEHFCGYASELLH